MADLIVTAANVLPGAGAIIKPGTAGAAITAGQSLFKNAADSTLHPAKGDTTTDAAFVGIALNNAATGQPVQYLASGPIAIGATPVVGTPYVVSAANAGGIAPFADLATGNKLTYIGYGLSGTQLMVAPQVTGLAIP